MLSSTGSSSERVAATSLLRCVSRCVYIPAERQMNCCPFGMGAQVCICTDLVQHHLTHEADDLTHCTAVRQCFCFVYVYCVISFSSSGCPNKRKVFSSCLNEPAEGLCLVAALKFLASQQDS